MRITSLSLTDYPPIKNIQITNLGNTVVIAGANGSGKTRLKQAIVGAMQGQPTMAMTIEATRPEEETKYFGGKTLSVTKGQKNPKLQQYTQSRKFGSGRFVGSLVQIDSNRSVQTLNYTAVNWLGADPDDSDTAGSFYFSPFTNRWQDFVNYIHQKSASRDRKIAEAIKKDPQLTGEDILKKHPNPLDKYKAIFADALPGKVLEDIDPAQPKEFQYRDELNQLLNFASLSSGEQEVIKILFDVARKDIRHSVVIVDEPELHLHPTLTFKLIEALKSIGQHTNQFIFLTHSSDLISTYYATGDVFFIASNQDGSNQAHRLSELGSKHPDVIPLIGQNMGLFAVGRKLVFVEGEESSIDRLAYQKLAQRADPHIRVIPAGSVLNVMALNNLEQQLRTTIFGIDLYMIRDRDGLSNSQIATLENAGRVRCLKRRHIENYFLDSELLQKVATTLYLTSSKPELTAAYIAKEIERIAHETIGYSLYKSAKDHIVLNHFVEAPRIRDVNSKSLVDIKCEIQTSVAANMTALAEALSESEISTWLDTESQSLEAMLSDGSWVEHFHGKLIFSRFCGEVFGEDTIRVRSAYIDIALEENAEVLHDLVGLFSGM